MSVVPTARPPLFPRALIASCILWKARSLGWSCRLKIALQPKPEPGKGGAGDEDEKNYMGKGASGTDSSGERRSDMGMGVGLRICVCGWAEEEGISTGVDGLPRGGVTDSRERASGVEWERVRAGVRERGPSIWTLASLRGANWGVRASRVERVAPIRRTTDRGGPLPR
jgi:hypothetical protein